MRSFRERLLRAFGAGEDGEGPAGGCRSEPGELREELLPPEERHGREALAAAAGASFPALAALAGDPSLAPFRLEEALFLDTETTGLSGGAGTLVFLCGTARFRGDGAVLLRQHFLPSPAAEPAFLGAILEDLAAAPLLVTYCGKSFDRHRLADRFVLHGLDASVRTRAHLDLLHLARRAWRERLDDLRLRTVEEGILSVEREGDLPGSLCPELYLAWLRGHAVDLEPVFRHNRMDVISLALILARLGQDPAAEDAPRWLLAAHARRFDRADPARAAALYGRAGEEGGRTRCLLAAARRARR